MQNKEQLCPIYHAQVLPDENDMCSLCGKHSASEELSESLYWALRLGNTARVEELRARASAGQVIRIM